MSYAPYPHPQAPRPPVSIKVFGILAIVFGSLGLFGILFTYIMYFGNARMFGPNPAVAIARESETFMTWMKVSLGLQCVMSPMLLASGIGLLKRRAWARKTAIAYALYGIVGGLVGLVMTWKYLIAPLSRMSGPAAAGGTLGGMIGGVVGMVFPVLLLIFMTKRNVREALTRAT
jgi:hypothetical protein